MPSTNPAWHAARIADQQLMWLEAILTREDLEHALCDLAPFTLKLGERGSVQLEKPTAVTLIEGRGLRVSCPAMVHGSVLGVDVPVTIRSADILLIPSIAARHGGDVVVFQAKVEAIDLTGVPHLVEKMAIDAINGALADHDTELCWDFRDTLSHRFALPTGLTGAPTLELSASWGELRITPEALVFAVSIKEGAGIALAHTSPAPERQRPQTTWTPRRVAGVGACVALVLAVSSVAAAHLLRRQGH